ncbi:MAG: restriction endonuclease [Nanoarchaeota archaeon]
MVKDLELNRSIVTNYIKKNPNATYREIRKNTKLKVERLFPGCMKGAYNAAGVPFSKHLSKRTKEEMLRTVIKFIKKNPSANTVIIKRELEIEIPKTFGRLKEAYRVAGVEHVPKIKVSGTAIPEIRMRSIDFENKVIKFLESKGKVKSKIRTKKGKQADALFYLGDKTYVIEIKNYVKKKITLSEIKQIIRYMEELNHKDGILVHSYDSDKVRYFSSRQFKVKVVSYKKLGGFLKKENQKV